MGSRERAFLYSLLIVIVGFNVILLVGKLDKPALADYEAWLDDLGPADRLILAGDSDLVVENRDGRISWADSPHGQAYAIAFVHVQKVLEALMETPQYKDDRESLTEEIKEEENEWRNKYTDLQTKYEGVTAEDERAAEAQQEFGAWQREFQQWRVDAQERVNDMAVEQLETSYREVIEAVEIISEENSIDLVLRFTPTADELPTERHESTMLDIRMRPVLKYPEGLDITPEVMEELALDDE